MRLAFLAGRRRTAPPLSSLAARMRASLVIEGAGMARSETTGGQHASAGRISRYRRAVDLPKLIGLWLHEIEDRSPAGRAWLIARLRAALRAERQRGLAGRWTYDLARHTQLLAAYRAEVAEDAALRARSAKAWDATNVRTRNEKGPAARRSHRNSDN